MADTAGVTMDVPGIGPVERSPIEVTEVPYRRSAASRGLLRAVRAKYQYELRQAIHDSLQSAIGRATRDGTDGDWLMGCESENVMTPVTTPLRATTVAASDQEGRRRFVSLSWRIRHFSPFGVRFRHKL